MIGKKKTGQGEEITVTRGWRQMLDAVPLRNEAARELQDSANGGMVVAVPTVLKPWHRLPLVRWVVRVPEARELHLDPVGAAVWRACDGSRTVEDIILTFAVQYRLTFHESRVSVTTYLRSLIQRGALAVALD